MAGRLENRKALITGGANGIGLGIAQRFAEEGANLFLCDINPERLQRAEAELGALGGRVSSRVTDVSDQKAVQEMVRFALGELGQLDILVNNAGVFKVGSVLDLSAEELDRVMKVNVYGVFYVTQAVLPQMMERRKGKIINIASGAGKVATPFGSAYSASKHAVVGLTRSIGLELGPYGVNVNAICPTLVDTELWKNELSQIAQVFNIPEEAVQEKLLARQAIPRLIKPREIGDLAVYLASDESDSVTCQSIAICCGQTQT
jgi:meso-butanediol dehydrogenase / (S,S)-butanediol dehydrogenase / diacetyl reductase